MRRNVNDILHNDNISYYMTLAFYKRISAVLTKYIPELSVVEKKAWTELAIWGTALLFVWMRLTAGIDLLGQSIGLTVIEQSAARLFGSYLGVGILAAIAQLVVWGYFKSKGESIDFRDERDLAIEKQANQSAYWVGVFSAQCVILHVLANDAFKRSDFAILDLTSATGVVLALVTILLLQEIARNIAMLILYKRS